MKPLKLFLIISLTVYLMPNKNFENLLGKRISQAEEFFNCKFEKNKANSSKVICINNLSINEIFYGIPYHYVTLVIDKRNSIESIKIHFTESINREFYEEFNKKYGVPDSILVIENKKLIGETTVKNPEGNITQYSMKSKLKLREGTFEENPLYIIWHKKQYEIKVLFRQENVCEMTFSINK